MFCSPGGLFSIGQRLRRTLQLVESSSELEELDESSLELLDLEEDEEVSRLDFFFLDFLVLFERVGFEYVRRKASWAAVRGGCGLELRLGLAGVIVGAEGT